MSSAPALPAAPAAPAANVDDDNHVVYIFRSLNGTVRYIGRGKTSQRPQDHARGSHNLHLAKLIESGKYSLEIAGPYTAEQARMVEAALISAFQHPATHRALFNGVKGHGPQFAPLGVPPEFASRLLDAPLTLGRLGQLVGGVLLVRIGPAKEFTYDPDRAKFDPLRPSDAAVADNVTRWWLLERLITLWAADPSLRPAVVVGVAGPPDRRYVVGSFAIDHGAWDLAERRGSSCSVPTVGGPDAGAIRGRIVEGASFGGPTGADRYGSFIWVDATGRVRHHFREGIDSASPSADPTI